MSFSNFYENAILAAIRLLNLELALHTGDPGEDQDANEVVGGAYARQDVSFGAPAAGEMLNDVLVQFDGMPATTVTHMSLWNKDTGDPVMYGTLDEAKELLAGQTAEWRVGTLIARVS